MAPLDSRYTQVGFKSISIQVRLRVTVNQFGMLDLVFLQGICIILNNSDGTLCLFNPLLNGDQFKKSSIIRQFEARRVLDD